MNFEEKWKNRCMIRCSCCYTRYTMDEMMQCFAVWVGKNEKYGKAAVCKKCGKEFHKGKWQITSKKDIYTIFTTDLEMPQCPPNFHEDILDSEYFYETMIQNNQDGKWLGFQARYKVKEDAIEGHWLAYDHLEDMLLNPEKYPQGIMPLFVDAIKQAKFTKNLYSEEAKNKSK